jgi:8-oxo-dGTP pyrophosphatase MutT (NUDIX family)
VTGEKSERVAVGAVIVDEEGRAFVHRRAYDRALFPGSWDIPGGHVEGEETPLEALAREVYEETGWRLAKVVADLGESVWIGDDGVRRREFDYLIEVEGDLTSPRLEHPKHIEYDWVDADDLDRLLENPTPDETLVRDIVARGISEAVRRRSTP